IDDGLANLELRSRFRNGRKLLRPVVAAPGVDCHSPVVQVNLRPITIYLDLVNPVVAGRSLFLESRIARLYKSWHRRFGGGRHVSLPAAGSLQRSDAHGDSMNEGWF